MLPETREHQNRRPPAAGTVVAATLSAGAIALAVLAFFYLHPPGASTRTTQHSPLTSRAAPMSPIDTQQPTASDDIEAAASAASAPWPAATVDHSPSSPSMARAEASEQHDTVTLKRSGTKIRLAPSARSRVVGTARKGTRFDVTRRSGRWVEVESEGLKGWVSGRSLRAEQPGKTRLAR
jgi:hypothetical protein